MGSVGDKVGMQFEDLFHRIGAIFDNHEDSLFANQLLDDGINNLLHLLALLLVLDHACLESDSQQIVHQGFLVDLD